jgi:hypothetical protein
MRNLRKNLEGLESGFLSIYFIISQWFYPLKTFANMDNFLNKKEANFKHA